MAKQARKKIEMVAVYQGLAKVINRVSTLPPFPNQYWVTYPTKGAIQVLSRSGEDPDIVEIVPLEALVHDIVKYCERELSKASDYQLTHREAEAAAKYWTASTDPVPTPKMFSWPDERGLTFTRLPWNAVSGSCPTWDALLLRMSNRDAFKAWIGSLFDPKSYLQQYIWLQGKGNDGKGSINRFLSKVFGLAYCSKQPKERGDKFWSHDLLGKRLVVFPDCNDQNFITSGFFKSLTGGDPIGVEAKGKMGYTVRLNCKYLILSNEKPGISSEVADLRRLIYCELKPRNGGQEVEDEGFEEALWREGGAFLNQCVTEYRETAVAGSPIKNKRGKIYSIVETNEMQFAEMTDFYFNIHTPQEKKCTPPLLIQRVLNMAFKSRKLQLEFLEYLDRNHHVKKHNVDGDNKKRIKVYKNISIKPMQLVSQQKKP